MEDKGSGKIGFFSRLGYWWFDYIRVVYLALRGMERDNITILASGMVYSTLIAIIPCLTFLIAFLSAFGVLQPFMHMISMLLEDTFGTGTGRELVGYIEQFSSNAMSLGVIGLVSFICTGLLLVNKIYTTVNQIFRTKPSSGAVRRFTAFLSFLILGALMVAAVFAVQSIVDSTLRNMIIGDEKQSGLMRNLLSFAIIWIGLTLLFKAVPNTKISFSSASVGATTGSISLMVATFIFRLVTARMVRYSVIYGSMASLFVSLLFLFICWFIILFSAELVYVHQFRPDKTLLLGNSQSPSRQVSEAVNALLLISDKYRRGDGAMGQKELVRRLAIPSARLSAYLSDFEDARMIMAVNTQRTLFAPARPLDQIKLGDVMRVLYGGVADEDSIETIGEAVAADFFRSGTASLENVTVENLLERI